MSHDKMSTDPKAAGSQASSQKMDKMHDSKMDHPNTDQKADKTNHQ